MPNNDYVFVEEWHIPASVGAVWDVIADARELPKWWRGVYLEAEPLDGAGAEPRVGARVRGKARGFLPYRLNFIIEARELVRPTLVAVSVAGDLTGSWRAVLSECDGGTHVALEQRVSADKPILRVLSPVLKPLFAANHRWTTPRGEAGLRAYLAERGQLDPGASAELPSRRRGWVPVPLVGALLLGAGALTVYWLLRQRQ
jgi:uncharacterized protein YndB with AHSA1/START domain